LEVNLLDSKTSPEFVADFLIKNRVPVIVTAPEYIAHLIAYRAARRGQYKIICALDFPKGNNFAMDKIYRTHPDLAAADGYDILLTNRKSGVESKNEMKALYEFFKLNNSFADIRWCIGGLTRSNDDIVNILDGMDKYPPSLVRMDNHLVTPKATDERHSELISLVKDSVPFPLKLSGNVSLKTIETFDNVKRFDVSIEQAMAIVKEIESAKETESSEKVTS
jgi:hypothetical protein